MPRIGLQESWQAGPASIEVTCDELELDDGTIGTGVLLEVETKLAVEEAHADLGVLAVELPETKAHARLTVCASIDQARRLRDALSRIINGEAP